MVILAGFCMATFRPARQRYDKQWPTTQCMECRVLSCGGAKSCHAKTRKVTIWRGFAWRLFSKTGHYDMGLPVKCRFEVCAAVSLYCSFNAGLYFKKLFVLYYHFFRFIVMKYYKYLSCVPGVDGKIHPEGVVQHRR